MRRPDLTHSERADTFSRIKVEGIMEPTLGIVVTYDSERGGTAVLGRHAIADAGLYSTCLSTQNLWLAATTEASGWDGSPSTGRSTCRSCWGHPTAFGPWRLMEIVFLEKDGAKVTRTVNTLEM